MTTTVAVAHRTLASRHPLVFFFALTYAVSWSFWLLAAWPIPQYGPAGFVVPLVLAAFYSWIYNKTQSVLLCILLHASFTAAQDHLLLAQDSPVVDGVLVGCYLLAAFLVIAISRGRLGYTRHETATDAPMER
jgi:hypothetical protein